MLAATYYLEGAKVTGYRNYYYYLSLFILLMREDLGPEPQGDRESISGCTPCPDPGGKMNTVWLSCVRRRYWYHLYVLVVVVPAIYLKPYLDLQASAVGAAEAGLRGESLAVGPWHLELKERAEEEPFWHPSEGFVKSFRLKPCAACVSQIRPFSSA
ncbi:hypothetical protein [Mesorhizobium sp. INR15]|uniref:hypothetical protein n=1 Tax=Mesorhizobium sp. INR15 TaxID=2654248 RepID=UPI0018966B8D|nr:hypothetical protein [Mesorhizobium sp. INR15]QPC89835.1 hypothetical protein GA829_04085 [Mesorhizobium sp. INR15]